MGVGVMGVGVMGVGIMGVGVMGTIQISSGSFPHDFYTS